MWNSLTSLSFSEDLMFYSEKNLAFNDGFLRLFSEFLDTSECFPSTDFVKDFVSRSLFQVLKLYDGLYWDKFTSEEKEIFYNRVYDHLKWYNSDIEKSETEILSLMPEFLKKYHYDYLKTQKILEDLKSGKFSEEFSEMKTQINLLTNRLKMYESEATGSTSAPSTSAGPSTSGPSTGPSEGMFGPHISEEEASLKRARGIMF